MLGDNYPVFDNEHLYTPEELANFAIKFDSYNEIKKVIRRCGLEGTEDMIKKVYQNVPGARDYMLKRLYEIWRGLK